MMPNRVRSDAEYPTWIAFVFIFNLIVGTGALTLPNAFAKAGWLLSLVVLLVLAVISYMSVTFVIEALSCANAVKSWQDIEVFKGAAEADHDDEADANDHVPLLLSAASSRGCDHAAPPERRSSSVAESASHLERLPLRAPTAVAADYYSLDRKFELGEMAVLFFNDSGRALFYLCIAIYLYGDLSIYSAAVAKTMRDVVCGVADVTSPLIAVAGNATGNASSDDALTRCWTAHAITRFAVYRWFVVGFTVLLGPFSISDVQKTKYIQVLTVVFRWLAFTFMICIATKLLVTNGARGHPAAVNVSGLPALFGACIYSFMCHHSLPSLLAPIRDKRSVGRLLASDYVLIAAFYIILAMTGIFAFSRLEDLYTLNFIPTHNDGGFMATVNLVIDYFLALFPVFTLSASFPIIAITLRNNLQALFLDMTRLHTYNLFVRRLLFPLLVILPPFVVTCLTDNLVTLVGFTGCYAGAAIQYLIPIALVYSARRTCAELLGNGIINTFRSPFASTPWLVFVMLWAWACILLVTANLFMPPQAAA